MNSNPVPGAAVVSSTRIVSDVSGIRLHNVPIRTTRRADAMTANAVDLASRQKCTLTPGFGLIGESAVAAYVLAIAGAAISDSTDKTSLGTRQPRRHRLIM